MAFFPETLRIRITNTADGSAVPDIAVFLRLFARLKNDYNILLPISGPNGEILVERKWVEEEIQKYRNMFLMDYSSTLDECDHVVELEVPDDEGVQKALAAMTMYKKAYKITEEEIDNLRNASNAQFKPILKRFDLEKQTEIELPIELLG